jgi:hypothetical protein
MLARPGDNRYGYADRYAKQEADGLAERRRQALDGSKE